LGTAPAIFNGDQVELLVIWQAYRVFLDIIVLHIWGSPGIWRAVHTGAALIFIKAIFKAKPWATSIFPFSSFF
jgi:hypothetical protein